MTMRLRLASKDGQFYVTWLMNDAVRSYHLHLSRIERGRNLEDICMWARHGKTPVTILGEANGRFLPGISNEFSWALDFMTITTSPYVI